YIKSGMKDEEEYSELIEKTLQGKVRYKRLPVKKEDNFQNRWGKFILKSKANIDYFKFKYNPRIKKYLIKDPIACMSSEWLHNRFDMEVVIVIRHPAAFVASLKRLNWDFDLNELICQEELMQDHLRKLLAGIKIDNL